MPLVLRRALILPAAALAAVERQAVLGVTADGQFGPETAAVMDKAIAGGTLKPK
jgi:hypothetical protein